MLAALILAAALGPTPALLATARAEVSVRIVQAVRVSPGRAASAPGALVRRTTIALDGVRHPASFVEFP